MRQFGEGRLYTHEGDRTIGGAIETAESLAARMNTIKGYPESCTEEKVAVAEAIQRWLYDTIIKPSLEIEGVKVEVQFGSYWNNQTCSSRGSAETAPVTAR